MSDRFILLVEDNPGDVELTREALKSARIATRLHAVSDGVEALAFLGERKGYRLVHTELTGNNAFLVRSDLPGDFPAPEHVLKRRSNFFLLGHGHRPDELGRQFVDVLALT